MKTYGMFELRHKRQATFRAREPASKTEPGAQSHDALPRHSTQAERAVIHPEHHDLEWRYCRGGWAG